MSGHKKKKKKSVMKAINFHVKRKLPKRAGERCSYIYQKRIKIIIISDPHTRLSHLSAHCYD